MSYPAGTIGPMGGATPASTAFRHRDALSRGATRARVQGALDHGRIVRLRRGVYGIRGERVDRIAAAVLRLAGDPVASHETAAELWGIPLLGGWRETIQMIRARRGTGADRYPGLTVHHATVPEPYRTVHRGVPVTSPARIVMDLARAGEFRAGVAAADGALRARLCTRDEMVAVADDCAGWPGARRARAVARFADPRAANPLESISRVAFHEYGLPRPLLQAEVLTLDIVDFLWDRYGVVGEADGLGKYADASVLRREKHRQEALEQDGLAVVRWTWREAYRRPDAIADRAAVVLQRRGWRP